MQKVFVGLSGGVDSAVSAGLLKAQGHNVIGVFIRIYRPEFIECTWRQDRLDAMRVCAALSIPFREIDLSEEYKRGVVDGMLADYAAGVTPNPDALCNRVIKFGAFLSWALQNGADKIATGHYSQIGEHDGSFKLLRSTDKNKDQSYFLFRLTQDDLRHTLFPVGGLLKSEVRQMAVRFDLPVATKRDSQGLCFIGDVSMKDFLARYIPVTPGPVLNTRGQRIGEHHGAVLVTIGQRHGFMLTGNEARKPHYVVSIAADRNEIVVSPNRKDAAVMEVALRDLSWVSELPLEGDRIEVQARYREQTVNATIMRIDDDIRVRFDEPHIAPPGQSLVVYKSRECIGGGVIRK